MDHLPIFLNVKDQRALVVGDGTLAARKADLLIRAGCDLTVIAPAPNQDLLRLLSEDKVTHKTDGLIAADLDGCIVAYGASADTRVNQELYHLASAAGVLVNIADNPDYCDFIMPAIVDRSPLVVAIGSGGTSPLLVRSLKARLETIIPAAYGRLAEFAGSYREKVKEAISNMSRRRRFWETMVEGAVAEHIFSGQEEQAATLMDSLLREAASAGSSTPNGEVYLVGTGPGDPDLLTFRALRLMQQADVVLYDRLIGDGILNLVRRDARRIYVGKKKNNHSVAQQDISEMLVRLAQEGKRVLRLKGGDPFVFGRGGEEIATLADNDVAFQVIPGVTAANGCSTYAGIPLTHRDHAQGYTVITGHEKNGELNIDFKNLLQPRQTTVIYMGLSSLRSIVDGLLLHGADATIPAAIIENGTNENQRVVVGTLANLREKAALAQIQSPALIIIGSVVGLRDKLSWFGEEAFLDDQPELLVASA